MNILTFGSRVKFLMAAAALMMTLSAAFAAAQDSGEYVVGPQDVLTIQVFDQPDISGRYTVEADGTIAFPLIGRIKAGGLTLRKFETELQKRLADERYFRDPHVSVGIEQYKSQRIFVMGEVRSPGPMPLTGGMTLLEALARAGSTTAAASGEVAIVRPPHGSRGPTLPDPDKAAEILRANVRDFENGSMKQNFELRDGDTIFVPRAESAYVFGEVKSPGAFVIQKNTTILQALSLAGGVTENAAMNRIKIVRIVNGEKKEIKVKLTDTVRPGDTIIVPQRYF